MSRPSRRSNEPARLVRRHLNNDEIDTAIRKLEALIAEVGGLKGAQWMDPRREVLEKRIQYAILDVFGQDSAEYSDHAGFGIYASHAESPYEEPVQSGFQAGIPRAVALLNGLITGLRERRAEAVSNPAERSRQTLRSSSIHERISAVVMDLFEDGHYSNAVFDAGKALVNYVKEKSGVHDRDGVALMQHVFSARNPVLAFNDLKTQTDQDEQVGMMNLFQGAVAAIRNPRGHSFFDDSAEEALEYILLLSMLARRLEKARRQRSPPAAT